MTQLPPGNQSKVDHNATVKLQRSMWPLFIHKRYVLELGLVKMDVYVQAILRLACKSSAFVAKHADEDAAPTERMHTRSTRQSHHRHHIDISDAALDHMVEMELEKRTLVHTQPSVSDKCQVEDGGTAEPKENEDE